METPVQPAPAPDDERVRLQELVAELMETNQELRFEVQGLRQTVAEHHRALAEASAVYRLLVP